MSQVKRKNQIVDVVPNKKSKKKEVVSNKKVLKLSKEKEKELSIQAARDLDVMSKYVQALNFIARLPKDLGQPIDQSLLNEASEILKKAENICIPSTTQLRRGRQTLYRPRDYLGGIIQGDLGNINLEHFALGENDMNWTLITTPKTPAVLFGKKESDFLASSLLE